MKSPTVAVMTRQILRCYAEASTETIDAGERWYDEAQSFAAMLAQRYGTTVEVASCVLAAHSLNCRWAVNRQRAQAQLAGNPVGLGSAKAMAAAAIAHPDDPFAYIVGPKIGPFAHNIAGDLSFVATDRWAQRVAFNTSDDQLCKKLIRRKDVRKKTIAAYKKAASVAGKDPAVMQAIAWVHVRKKSDLSDEKMLNQKKQMEEKD